MERYSLEQRIQIIQIHYRNYENYTDTCRELRALYGNNEAPSRQIIMNLIKHFESVGHVGDVKTPIRSVKVKSGKTITNVIERLAENQANESDTAANSDRLDDPQSAVPSTEGSLSNKRGGNDGNDTATPEGENDSSTTKGTNEGTNCNSNAVSKASRKTKKPRHR